MRRLRAAPPLDREALVARLVSGPPARSFLDVGALWSVHGAVSFAAERAGASRVTALDVMAPTPEFEAERERTGSAVAFVHGDLHDAEVEPHDVVWCSGVLYHVPHPILTLQRLHALTTRTLILATETARGPGRRAVFAPSRRDHPNVDRPLDPAQGYVGWWWLPTAEATVAMLEATGFRVSERHERRHHITAVAIKA